MNQKTPMGTLVQTLRGIVWEMIAIAVFMGTVGVCLAAVVGLMG